MIEQKLKNLGRRKSAVALVKLVIGTGLITINGKDCAQFLQFNPSCVYFI